MTREEKIAKIKAAERQLKIDKIAQAEKLEAMKSPNYDQGMVADELETGLKTAADTFSLGYSPQLVGLYDSLTSDESYVDARDKYAKELELLKQANPKSAAVGTVAGIGGTLLVPGLGKARLAKLGVGARSAITGAGFGALSNPGDTEGEVSPLQLDKRAVGGTLGAATGGVLGKVLPAISSGAGKLARATKSKAQEKAFEALGPSYANIKRYGSRVHELGQEVFDKGLLRVAPVGKKTLLKRAKAESIKAGKKIGEITDDLAKLEDDIGKISKAKVSTNLRKRLIDKSEAGDPNENKYFSNRIKSFIKSGESASKIGAKKTQEVKTKAGNNVNWKAFMDSEGSRANRYNAALSDELGLALLNKADDAAAAGAKINKKVLQQARKSYTNLAPIREILENSSAKQGANLGLTSLGNLGLGTIGAVGGAFSDGGSSTGAGVGALGLMGAGLLNRRYGAATSAQLLRASAPMINKAGIAAGRLLNPATLGVLSTQTNPLTGYETLLEKRTK